MISRSSPVVGAWQLKWMEPLRRVPPVVRAAAAFVCLTLLLIFALSSSRGSLLLPGLGTGLVALWLMLHPHWGVLAILAAWSAEVDPLTVKFITFSQLIAAVLLIPLGFAILRDRSLSVWRTAEVKILAGIGGVLLLAAAWSQLMLPPPPIALVTQSAELYKFATHFFFLILFLYFIRTPRHIFLVTLVLVLLILVAVCDGTIIFLRAAGGLRLRSFLVPGLGNPNRMAYATLFALGLIWFFRLYAPVTRWRSLTLPLLSVLPLVTLLTASRAGFLQLMVFGGLALRDHRGLTAARKVQGLVLIGAIVMLIAVIVPSASYLRATSFQATYSAPGGDSLKNRITTIKAGIEMTLENPLLGVGPGNFRWRHQVLYGDSHVAHNSYLWALTSGGPLLLVLYLFLYRRIYRRLAAVERSGHPSLSWLAKALRITLIVFLFQSLFGDDWLGIFPYVFLGIGIAASRLSAGTAAAAAERLTWPRRPYQLSHAGSRTRRTTC